MSQSVTSTGLYVACLLQIETNRPAKSKTTAKVPVPFVVAGLPAQKKSPPGVCSTGTLPFDG